MRLSTRLEYNNKDWCDFAVVDESHDTFVALSTTGSICFNEETR